MLPTAARYSPDLRHWATAACIAIVLLALVAYAPAFSFEFVNYDDPLYVTENPHVANGITPASLVYAWTTFDLGNWIPITWLSYLLDATVFGIRPAGFHGTNIVGHAANSALLFSMLRHVTGFTVRSMVVAALFAIHPLHIQSVAWVSERKDILSTLFLLLTIVAYERYAARPNGRSYACVAVAMTLGLLCKPMLVTLPVLLLLLDYWPLCRWSDRTHGPDQPYPPQSAWHLLLEKLPLLSLAAVDGVVTVIAQRSIDAMQTVQDLPPLIRSGNAIHGIGWYLWKSAIPLDLSPFYPHPGDGLSWITVCLSLTTIVGISGLAGWQWKRRPYLVTGWLWFLTALLPVLGFLQVGAHAYADRFSYVPHIGLFVMAVWLVAEIGTCGPLARWGLGVTTTFVLAACFCMLRHELAPWRNSTALWEHALRVTVDNAVAHHNMGEVLLKQGRRNDAKPHFERTVSLDPNHFESILALGFLHLEEQRTVEAHSYVEWARRLRPHDQRCCRLWEILEKRGGNAEAQARGPRPEPIVAARDALRRGLDCARRGDMAAAEAEFVTALAHEPDYAEAHNNLGLVLFDTRRFADAESHFRLAIISDPQNADFACNLASLLENQSRWSEARTQLEKVLELKPTDAEAQIRLKRLRRMGDPGRGTDPPP